VSQARVINADAIQGLKQVKDQTVQTCITSPPYWGLRDYGSDDQLGLEPTPEEYTENLVSVFREVRRVLRDDGTLWLNLGDSYAGARSAGGGTMAGFNDRYFGRATTGDKQRAVDKSKPSRPKVASLKDKDLVGIPWRVAFALQADGWYLRSDIIWHKPNPMPESVTDRPTKAHEYLFLLTKSPRYYYDVDAIREEYLTDNDKGLTKEERLRRNPHLRSGVSRSAVKGFGPSQMKGQPGGRNKRSVWTVTTKPFKGAHFAVFPPDLIEPCVLAGSAEGDTVLDPFTGSGTTGMVALRHGRDFVGTELNPEYAAMAEQRIAEDAPLLNEVAA
jgi:DNA modification methylase